MCCFLTQEVDTPLIPEESALPPPLPPPSHLQEPNNSNPMPSLNLSLSSEFDSMENSPRRPEPPNPQEATMPQGTATFPLFLPGGYFSSPFPIWPAIVTPKVDEASACYPHQVLKPIPLLPKEPVNVDALVGMSHLSLVETESREPSPLSLKLLSEPSRQSAFHVKASGRGSELVS